MAGDWIKMRTDLYRDPKVCLIAEKLLDQESLLSQSVNQNLQCNMTVTRNVTRNAAVGALLSVWGVVRRRGKREGDDLVLKNCSLMVLDDISDLPGFGAAMATVGWVVETNEGLVFPKFFESNNVDPSDEKNAKNAEKQRRYRKKKQQECYVTRDVTALPKCRPREEKRRVDIDPIYNARARGDYLPLENKDKAALLANYWNGDAAALEADCEAARDNLQRHGETLTPEKAFGYMKNWHRNKKKFDKPPGASDKREAWSNEVIASWGGVTFEKMADHE